MSDRLRVLHIAAHLGGGVGKAHCALAEAEPSDPVANVEHAYALLEEPRDLAYVERLRAAGRAIHIAPALDALAELADGADIVQLEWWGHPRLYSLLTTNYLPDMRLVAWIHVSGLATPLIPPALVDLADRTLFTAGCSLRAGNLREAIARRPEAFGVASSGFGLAGVERTPRAPSQPLRLGYLGTLDFAKMHPEFFDLIDAVESDIVVELWGRHDPAGEVATRAAAMRRPNRVRFMGFAEDPARVFSHLDVFVYLLARDHYGTAENALVEAMSAGVAPIVFDNPAEAAIVTPGKTGMMIAHEREFAPALASLLNDRSRLAAMAEAARADAAARFSPSRTRSDFAAAYDFAMTQPKRPRDFAAALGLNARDWFLDSLSQKDGQLKGGRMLADAASKGSLGHFRACLPGDESLAALTAGARRTG